MTTNVSGAEEIISEAECGLLTEVDDESLYRGLRKVCETPDILDVWKHKLQETKKRFSVESRIKRLINLFQLTRYE